MSLSDLNANGMIFMLIIKKLIRIKKITKAWVMIPASFKNAETKIIVIFLYMLTISQ